MGLRGALRRATGKLSSYRASLANRISSARGQRAPHEKTPEPNVVWELFSYGRVRVLWRRSEGGKTYPCQPSSVEIASAVFFSACSVSAETADFRSPEWRKQTMPTAETQAPS